MKQQSRLQGGQRQHLLGPCRQGIQFRLAQRRQRHIGWRQHRFVLLTVPGQLLALLQPLLHECLTLFTAQTHAVGLNAQPQLAFPLLGINGEGSICRGIGFLPKPCLCHRDTGQPLVPELAEVVEQHIARPVTGRRGELTALLQDPESQTTMGGTTQLFFLTTQGFCQRTLTIKTLGIEAGIIFKK